MLTKPNHDESRSIQMYILASVWHCRIELKDCPEGSFDHFLSSIVSSTLTMILCWFCMSVCLYIELCRTVAE